jgi:hypothetical protein
MVPELLRLSFPDLGSLEREITNNIRYGRVFVGEVLDSPVLTEGVLVIVHPVHGRELRLAAQVVMVNNEGPMRGTGIALRSFGPSEVELVQAFVRESAAGAGVAEPRGRVQTPQPRERAMTPPPRPRAETPQPRARTETPQPRARTETPQPRARALTAPPRPFADTSQARSRTNTPQPEARSRQSTPVPMPLTLSERPRRSTQESINDAVTVRPATGPIGTGTVPPTAPENDWSDLESSGFARAASRANAAPVSRVEAPVAVAARAVRPPARAEDDWSDFSDPEAEAKAAAILGREVGAETRGQTAADAGPDEHDPGLDHEHVALEDSRLDEHEHSGEPADPIEAADSDDSPPPAADGGDEFDATDTPTAPVDDDDWSDVAAAIASPAAPQTNAAVSSAADETEAEADSDETSDDDSAFDDDPNYDPNEPRASTELQSENRQERLRTLNVTEQLKIARRGELSDRIVIERLYGKQVWAALLQNPRLTLPEVARIARKGTVPRPLIEQICDNAQWTKEPNVRRALLGNPKMTGDSILKLLRMMPKHELKVMEKATAFPISVRDAARKLLREGQP